MHRHAICISRPDWFWRDVRVVRDEVCDAWHGFSMMRRTRIDNVIKINEWLVRMRKFAKTKEAVSKENFKFRTRNYCCETIIDVWSPCDRIILRLPTICPTLPTLTVIPPIYCHQVTELTSESGTDEETIIHSRDHNGKSGRHLVFTSDRPCVLHQPLLLLRHANFLV